MQKFYMILLAGLCAAGTGMAKDLNVKAPLRNAQTMVQKAKPAFQFQNAEMAPAKDLSATKSVVTSMRKPAADGTIEGTWVFSMGDYYFQTSTNSSLEVEFEATLEGTDVWFEDPTNEELPFVATYNEATGTLTFDRVLLGSTGTYYIYQQPFVYAGGLNSQSIVGVYDAAAGEIVFDADNGIAWEAYSDQAGTGARAGYFSIYDLEGAERSSAWIDLGEASFNENVIYGTFQGTENTEWSTHHIQAHATKAGIYRVFDPFSTLYASLGFSGVSPTMLIDASDPENVKVEMQTTGISGGTTDGTYYYFNEGWYCAEYDDELDPALACTMTVEDGMAVITFPYHSFTVYAATAGKFYYGSAYESQLIFELPVEEPELEVIGTYAMNILPTSILGEKDGEAVEIEVSVNRMGEDYWIAELGATNYFNDQYIHFTLNDSKMAIFQPSYAGQFDGQHTWFAPFVFNGSFTEPQDMYGVMFDAETGFEFPGDAGFAWFITETAEDFNASDVYAAFYVVAPSFADASIEGEWEIKLNGHYLGAYSLGEFTETFTATLEGNTVHFASSGSQYDIVAEFTAAGELTFRQALVGSATSFFGLYQAPYINVDGTEDLEELMTPEDFTATYDAAAGTITFPAQSGLRYGFFNNETGDFSYWDDAFDFVSATKVGGSVGIETVEAVATEQAPVYYDLNGRRVVAPKAGLFIKKSAEGVQKVIVE